MQVNQHQKMSLPVSNKDWILSWLCVLAGSMIKHKHKHWNRFDHVRGSFIFLFWQQRIRFAALPQLHYYTESPHFQCEASCCRVEASLSEFEVNLGQHRRSSRFKYQTWHFLSPLGSIWTINEYYDVNVFWAGRWSYSDLKFGTDSTICTEGMGTSCIDGESPSWSHHVHTMAWKKIILIAFDYQSIQNMLTTFEEKEKVII